MASATFARQPPAAAHLDRIPFGQWPDTLNNHLLPGTARAAVTVLESVGYRVMLQQSLCCGRPLYDYGALDLARTKLLKVPTQRGRRAHRVMPTRETPPATRSGKLRD